ncbi:MAG: sirohydrochlorin cobaltochelatase [Fusobacteriaceae bacterium]
MKRAIILSYHGTREREKSDIIYASVEKYITENFLEFKVVTVIDSEFLMKKMRDDGDQSMKYIDEILHNLYLESYEKVYIQPMYLIQGRLQREREGKNREYIDRFKEIKTLSPILGEMVHIKEFSEILLNKFNDKNTGYLFVGHGGEDIGNCALGMVGYNLLVESDNYFMSTIEEGITLDKVVKLIEEKQYGVVKIVPLLVQYGVHFNKDIKKISEKLEERGIRTEIVEETLFEYDEILKVIVERLKIGVL